MAITTVQAEMSQVASGKEIRSMALQLADVKGAALNFTDGQADAYDSDTLATKTNASYNSGNAYYSSAGSAVLISQGTGTNQGDGSRTNEAFDGNENQGRTQGTGADASANNTALNLGKFYSGGKTVSGYRAVGGNVNGFIESSSAGFTVNFYGSNSGFKTGGVLLDTYNAPSDSAGLVIDNRDLGSWTYDYFWVQFPASGSGTASTECAELQFYEPGAISNITLVSSPVTASSAPSTAFVTVQAKPVDSITLNTDLVAEVSRDGGTTWSTVTLTAGATNAFFVNYEGSVNISGQPSGTSMVIRITTANNKEVQVSGHVLRWA